MKRSYLIAVPLFILVLVVCSCTNVQKLYDKGNYKAVIEAIGKMKSPDSEDLLLQTKAYVNLGEEGKALESSLMYLLSYDGKDEQGRSFAVQVFLDTNRSDRIAVLALNKDDGFEARKTLYRAYCNLGDYDNAVQILELLSAEMDRVSYMNLIIENPVSDELILQSFSGWYESIGEESLDVYLTLLNRFSSEVSISESVAWKFLALADILMSNSYYNSDNIRLSAVLKIKGNILESLFDKVNARSYWSQAYNLNPDDEELRNKLR